MIMRALTPMLRTWDFPGTLAFYTGVLGFACEAGGADHGWAALRRDAVEIMVSAPNAHFDESAPTFTGSFYLRVENVDAWWASVKDRANVCYPIADFDYGMREFAIHDNNGYLLQFGRPLAGAPIRRE